MNNTELTLDQLAEIAGGLTGRTICSIKKTNPQWDVICDEGTSVQGDIRTGVLLGKKRFSSKFIVPTEGDCI